MACILLIGVLADVVERWRKGEFLSDDSLISTLGSGSFGVCRCPECKAKQDAAEKLTQLAEIAQRVGLPPLMSDKEQAEMYRARRAAMAPAAAADLRAPEADVADGVPGEHEAAAAAPFEEKRLKFPEDFRRPVAVPREVAVGSPPRPTMLRFRALRPDAPAAACRRRPDARRAPCPSRSTARSWGLGAQARPRQGWRRLRAEDRARADRATATREAGHAPLPRKRRSVVEVTSEDVTLEELSLQVQANARVLGIILLMLGGYAFREP